MSWSWHRCRRPLVLLLSNHPRPHDARGGGGGDVPHPREICIYAAPPCPLAATTSLRRRVIEVVGHQAEPTREVGQGEAAAPHGHVIDGRLDRGDAVRVRGHVARVEAPATRRRHVLTEGAVAPPASTLPWSPPPRWWDATNGDDGRDDATVPPPPLSRPRGSGRCCCCRWRWWLPESSSKLRIMGKVQAKAGIGSGHRSRLLFLVFIVKVSACSFVHVFVHVDLHAQNYMHN